MTAIGQMKALIKGRAINFLCCLFVMAALIACTSHGSQRPPESARHPPVYPGATILTTQKQGTSPDSKTYISYETDAEANRVLDFYKDTLLDDQWLLHESEMPGQLEMTWAVGCPFYSLTVKTATTGSGKTLVDLTLNEEACR